MASRLESIVASFKAARERKGLTQRALAKRVGMPQSHISKIESGSVDVQASTLIELAQALDLELALVPRTALPAVQALQDRPAAPSSRPADALRKLRQLESQLKHLGARFPDVIDRLTATLDDLRRLPARERSSGNVSGMLEAMSNTLREIERNASNNNREMLLRELARQGEHLRNLLNAIAHGQSASQARPLPAYRLTEAEDDSDG